jgi:hypothetical protein
LQNAPGTWKTRGEWNVFHGVFAMLDRLLQFAVYLASMVVFLTLWFLPLGFGVIAFAASPRDEGSCGWIIVLLCAVYFGALWAASREGWLS